MTSHARGRSRWLIAWAVCFVSGCSCGSDDVRTAPGCTSDDECEPGETCVVALRRCIAERDLGPDEEPDATPPPPPPVDAGPDGPRRRDAGPGCIDMDGDGYGERCDLGPDCDDTDPSKNRGERCDGIDNDCDGEIDEIVMDVCMSCVPTCRAIGEPGPDGWDPRDDNSANVEVDSDDALTLRRIDARAYAMWIANSDEGTVSKIDSRTGRELARYPSARPDEDNGARPADEPCNFSSTGNCPSRTAVDQNFDAYVANRAFGNVGTVTKFAGRVSDCVDRDGDGMIETSTDANDDGVIDPDDPRELVGPDDECILWTAAVGGIGSVPRALAIGLATEVSPIGDVWVGTFADETVCQLDPYTGAPRTSCVRTVGLRPYGAAADRTGRVWFVNLGWEDATNRRVLASIDPVSFRVTFASDLPDSIPPGSYGIAIDGDDHLWVGGARAGTLLRYDISDDVWEQADIPAGGTLRGVAADETHVWAADSTRDSVWQVEIDTMRVVREWELPTVRGPIGAGVAFDGRIWAIGRASSSAARIDPVTEEILEVPTGLGPYSYSDFMGFGLNTFAEPFGRYHFTVEGCADGESRWETLRWSEERPPGTRIEAWVRTAPARVELQFEDWIGPFTMSPADLRAPPGPVPPGLYLQVEFRLYSEDSRVAPRVFDADVTGTCFLDGPG
ncbi:MAG: hypothetical protein IT379_41100 [Deltaproteobacteria bacterium]|nr:hypothetical protein [Deltaproteobacteria bacterium]